MPAAVERRLPVGVVVLAAIGVQVVRPLHADAVAALALVDGAEEVAIAIAVGVAREEFDLLLVFIPGRRLLQVHAVLGLEVRLLLGIGQQVLPVDDTHGIVVEWQHVRDIDLADQVHQSRT
jgi:hypothetical protein